MRNKVERMPIRSPSHPPRSAPRGVVAQLTTWGEMREAVIRGKVAFEKAVILL
jgi:hypothetical protein